MPLRLRNASLTDAPAAVTAAAPGDSLCGYRVVRKLGDGPRAEVFLGFAESSILDDDAEPPAHPPETAAIKICRIASRSSAATELECLARAEHPHVVRLLDAATIPSGIPCLVLERLSRGSLAHLLEQRDALTGGEVVTILAPIASAVDALHDSGVLHGGIGASAVLFRASGAPVLARFGRASLIEPRLSAAARAALVADDRAALAGLAALLLARVDAAAPEAASAASLVEWVRAHSAIDEFGERLAARLFELAVPTAVSFDRPAPTNPLVPGRTAVAASVARGDDGHRTTLARLGARLPDEVVARAASFLRSLRAVRTPVWVAAASVLVAIVAALVLIPSGTDSSPARADPSPSERSGDSAAIPTGASPSIAVASDTPADAPADPLDALTALLDVRRQCFDQLSVLCLTAVDQDGSAALDDDADLIRGIRAGGEVDAASRLDDAEPQVVERLGDSVLVDLGRDSKPASVLMIRTEAGWRVRDYLD